MRRDAFWALLGAVDAEGGVDMEAKVDALTARLQALPPEEVLDFSRHFDTCVDEACTWELWGAAHVLFGGCSDDAFGDLRSSLLSLGREDFERTLAAPDCLAALPRERLACLAFEGFGYVAAAVYEERTGNLPPRSRAPAEPSGEPFDEDPQALAARYPRLWAAFGTSPLVVEEEPPPASPRPWWRLW